MMGLKRPILTFIGKGKTIFPNSANHGKDLVHLLRKTKNINVLKGQ